MSEIQDAFEAAVGFAPIEQAGVLLQRLPGLGRTSADSEDRQFVDTYLLDGLRAVHVISLVSSVDTLILDQEWFNALSEEGILICARKIASLGLADDSVSFCKKNYRRRNKTLILDIVCSLVVSGINEVDFGSVEVEGGQATVLDLQGVRIRGLYIGDSVIDKLVLSGAEANGLVIEKCSIGSLEGISNERGIPGWLKDNTVDRFTSIATVSRIKNANISANHKVLVTILRKTYFQKGAARKEEALLRGLGRLVKPGVVDRMLNKLMSENLLSAVKGDSGDLYAPVRAQTRRVGRMLAELNLSKDPVWIFADSL